VVEQTARTVATSLVDHWGWRPDWQSERPCLMWYLTFEDQPELADLALRSHERLRRLGAVDLIPVPWLHLTLDEVGFVDAVGPEDVDRVVESVRAVLARDPDYEPLPFWADVSLAYTNQPCDAASVLAPLAALADQTLTVSVPRLTLAASPAATGTTSGACAPRCRSRPRQPGQEPVPVHDDPGHLAVRDDLAVGLLLGDHLEAQQPPVDVHQARGHPDRGPDRAGADVLELDAGPDAGLLVGEGALHGRAGGRLAPGEQAWRGQHLEAARPQGQGRVVVGDRELQRRAVSGRHRRLHPAILPDSPQSTDGCENGPSPGRHGWGC
jgi:hypothetical protein